MTHNLRGGDPLQPRSPDRRSPERPYRSTPREIVREGIEYEKFTDKFDYPPEFSPGARGTRIGNLNIALLKSLGTLRDAVNDVSFAKAVLKHNEPTIDGYQKIDLQGDVDDAKKLAWSALALTRNIIGELDALGGAFHLPPRWVNLICGPDKWRRVKSGSLAHLANDPHYLAEECTAEDPAAYVGAKGEENLKARQRFDKVAYTINRIGYLKACQCKDKALEDLLDCLKEQVADVIKYAGEGTLLMPACIRQEVVRVLDEEKEERERERKQKEKKRKPLTWVR